MVCRKSAWKILKKYFRKLFYSSQRSPKTWESKVKKQIYDWINQASPADWKMLESQDPAQKISKLSFIAFVENQLCIKI